MRVRELPPLRLHVEAATPDGRHHRWGEDESDPANIPSGLTLSSAIPGGFDTFDCTLPRKPGIDYSDLKRLSTLRALGAGGDVAGECRLARVPSTSGDQIAVSPSAEGWQQHLEDDKSASMIYIDRDLSRWRDPSAARQSGLIVALRGLQSFTVRPNQTTGLPVLATEIQAPWSSGGRGISEAWYDAGPGNLIGRLKAAWAKSSTINAADTNWFWAANLATSDNLSTVGGTNLRAAGPGTINIAGPDRFALLLLTYNLASAASSEGITYGVNWSNVRVIGDHGLTLGGIEDTSSVDPADWTLEGFLTSDIVAHAVARWAPLLVVDRDAIDVSDFILAHLAFYDPTTAGEIVRQATSFGLQDWAVWENRRFEWYERGTRGRKWRTRIAPAQLSDTGPQIDNLWESILVQWQDVDGTTRTAGPVGSGADVEDASLHDADPDNPANQLGIVRRDLLQMSDVSTAAGAIEVGQRFLEQSKLLDSSGQAQLVGHVVDDRGVLWPAWMVRAGDQLSVIDARDTSYRRIVKASYEHDTRTCTVDLDAPADGLSALLERLSAVLVPLGIS